MAGINETGREREMGEWKGQKNTYIHSEQVDN